VTSLMIDPWTILDTLSDNLAILDQAGTICYLNASWQNSLTEDAAQVFQVGQDYLTAHQVAFPLEAAATQAQTAALQAILTGGAEEFYLDFPALLKGQTCWFYLNISPYRHAEMTGAIVRQRNITRRKLVELSLSQAHGQIEQIFNNFDQLVYIADMQTYELLFVNEYFRKIFGESVGKICWQVLQKDQTGPCSFCTNEKLIDATGQPTGTYTWESQNTVTGNWSELQDNAIRWTDGRLVRLQIATDITSRKQAEQNLRDAHIQTMQILDSLNQIVYVADFETYEILFVNKQVRDLFGDVTGKICWQVLQTGMTGPCPFCTNSKLVDEHGRSLGTYVWEFQNTIHGVWLDVRDTAIRWTDGRLVRMEIATNITERKQMEMEQIRLQNEVIQAQKQLLHELSTPMIPLTDEIVVLPLIGTLNAERAQQLLENLLEGVAAKRAKVVILDITALPTVDSQAAQALIMATQAVRLLGAQVILTGIRPDVAQTMVNLNLDLQGMVIQGTLQAGIAYAVGAKRR